MRNRRDLPRFAEIWRDFPRGASRQISDAISPNLACVSANLTCMVASFFMTKVAARPAAADKPRAQRRNRRAVRPWDPDPPAMAGEPWRYGGQRDPLPTSRDA